MKWKLKIDWRKVVLFLVISAGLLYLTRSVLMAAGVIMLLFVVDSLISDWEYRRKTHELFKLAGAGSNRQYYRLTGADGQTVIGVLGTSHDEDHAFVYLDRHFMQRKLPVPRVLAVSSDEMCYLQTDLGSTSLFDAIRGGREAGGRYNLAEKELLKRTIRQLPNLQVP